jgi:heat shock protein HslJ
MKRSQRLLLIIVLMVPVGIAATSPEVDDGLAATKWRLTSFGPIETPAPVIEGTSITLEFSRDGKIGGNGGCNSYGGDYQIRAESLSLSRIVSTKRACIAQNAMQQEQRYFEALGSVGRFKFSDNQLTIFYDGGRGALNFVKASGEATTEQSFENQNSPVELLASYFNAVNIREYERAYRYWQTPPGKLEDFARGYADTASVQLIVQPPTHIEGAAGSLYAQVPTVIAARHRDGSERVFSGCYVTRKTNLSPTDIPKQEVWRIYSASMRPIVGEPMIRQLLAQACKN